MGTHALPDRLHGYAAPSRQSAAESPRSALAAEPMPGADRFDRDGTGTASHAHLWVLLDGTPAHAAPGRLATNENGELACHLCGRWFMHLGGHLRRHGWTAERYRAAVGLALHVPLCGAELSGQIATRQKRNWDRSPAVRSRFSPGRELAWSGELARRSAAAVKSRQDSGQIPDAVLSARAGRLAAGRATQAEQRVRRLEVLVTAAGTASLHELLRKRYGAGVSIEGLAKLTGLGRRRLRAELTAAGVPIRPSGVNNPASKHARGPANDAAVAAQVGAADIRAWLLEQRQAGLTLRELAQRTGRSIPWIQTRLAGPCTPFVPVTATN